MSIPQEYKRHVSVKEEFGMVKVQVDDKPARCFIGSNSRQHAEEALMLIIDMIEAIKDDKARSCHRLAERFLKNKRPPMATRLRVIK